MELFLMVVFVSLLCLAVTALAFSAASNEDGAADRVSAEQVAEARPAAAPRFFAEDALTPNPPLPLNRRPPALRPEALLLQIERHIRLEQAAAEAFLDRPTPESLHSRTTSPLLN